MKKGDLVKLIGVPPGVRDDEHLNARALLTKCLGREFRIEEVEIIEGTDQPLIKIDVGEAMGLASYPYHLGRARIS